MPIQVTDRGITVPTLEEERDDLVEALRGVYGEDLDVSPSTPDGQRVAIIAALASSMNQALAAMWSAFDPDLAAGTDLDRIAKLTGLTRLPGESDAGLRRRRNALLYRASPGTAANLAERIRSSHAAALDAQVVDRSSDSSLAAGEIAVYVVEGEGDAAARDAAVGGAIIGAKPAGVRSRSGSGALARSHTLSAGPAGMSSIQWSASRGAGIAVAVQAGRADRTTTLSDDDMQGILRDDAAPDGLPFRRLGQAVTCGDLEAWVRPALPAALALESATASLIDAADGEVRGGSVVMAAGVHIERSLITATVTITDR